MTDSPDLIEALRHIGASDPGRVALLAHDRRPASYGDLVAMIDHLQAALTAAGVTRSSRVATLLPNGPETAVAILAIAAMATCIPINPAYPPAEIDRLLGEAGVSHLVSGTADSAGRPSLVLRPDGSGPAGAATLDVLSHDSTEPADTVAPSADRIALVLHTSGSTGVPKRVPLSVRNLAHSARSLAASLQLGPGDICLNMMPMFHIGALVDLMLAPLGAGGAVAFAGEISTPALFKALAAFHPTWFQAVPTVLRDILSHATTAENDADFHRLRLVRAVSQPLPQQLQATFEQRFGVPLVPIFGMTETAGLIASMPLGASVPGSVGTPWGCEVRIADAFGNELPQGRRGEVLIAGRNVMTGYENVASGDAVFRGPWLRSGDEGYFDAGGNLFLTGRLKDVINRGGEKISPLELDLLLADHPEIIEAAAFPLPHPTLGEEVGVAVVTKGGLSESDVIGLLRGRVADFKLPRQVVFLDRLPRVPSGKLDRLALPALAAGDHSGRIRTAPDSPIARTLASMWREVLEIDDVAMEDDFFDLGGDSLRVTTLAIEIEQRFGHGVPISELFDAPTLGEMAAMLSRNAAAMAADDGLDPEIHASLTRLMASWQGKRLPGSLIVGRNTMGRKTPFFWVPQTLHGFETVADTLDPDRPIYGMTSLSATGFKSDDNTRQLARYYAQEIRRIQPDGPYLIGGFCQGGVVAFHIAKALRAEGHDVALLALQDRFIAEPYEGAISLFWGKRNHYAIHDLNQHPERSWGKYYSGPVAVHFAEADHSELHNPPHLDRFVAQLEADMACAEAGEPVGPKLTPYQRMPEGSRVFALSPRLPLLVRQGRAYVVPVRVTNRSPFRWEPTRLSGLVLTTRWSIDNEDLQFCGDGQAEFDSAVEPGQTVTLNLTVRVPMRGVPLWLIFDVIEDGMFYGEAFEGLNRRRVVPLRPRWRDGPSG